MECFKPRPNDGYLSLVLPQLESTKRVGFRLYNDHLQLCNRSGQVIVSYPLDILRWTPCALPGGIDHCISLQIHTGGPKELLFKAPSRAAVASLVSRLDLAARQCAASKPNNEDQNTIHIHAVADVPEPPPEIADSISFGNQDDTRTISEADDVQPKSPAPCSDCINLTAEMAVQAQQLQHTSRSLAAALDQANKATAENTALDQQLQAVKMEMRHKDDALTEAAEREQELKSALQEAADKCQELSTELKSLITTSKQQADTIRELRSILDLAEEEKQALVGALTTAQAQLHDATTAFKEANTQLENAAKQCTDTRTRAAAAHADLETAQNQVKAQAQAAERAMLERDRALHELQKIKDSYKTSEARWDRERSQLDSALDSLRTRLDTRSTHIETEMVAANKILNSTINQFQSQIKATEQSQAKCEELEVKLEKTTAALEAAERRVVEESSDKTDSEALASMKEQRDQAIKRAEASEEALEMVKKLS